MEEARVFVAMLLTLSAAHADSDDGPWFSWIESEETRRPRVTVERYRDAASVFMVRRTGFERRLGVFADWKFRRESHPNSVAQRLRWRLARSSAVYEAAGLLFPQELNAKSEKDS